MKRTKVLSAKYTKSTVQYYQSIQLVLQAFKSTGYLVINKILIRKLGLVEAAVLSNYIDKFIYFQKKQSNFDGWFFLRHKDIMDHLNIKEPTVIRVKKDLINLGILRTKMKGAPAKEWIWVDFEQLVNYIVEPREYQGLDPYETGGLDPHVTGGLLRITNNKENIDMSVTKVPDSDLEFEKVPSGKLDIQKRNKQFLPLAKYLHEIIASSKNIRYSTSQINQWAEEIRKLSEINKIDFVRIKRALRWYKSNIGGEYIPVIESGHSLRMKFISLEAARQRQETPMRNSKDQQRTQEKERYLKAKADNRKEWARNFGYDKDEDD